jgi:hypothetical protein
VNVTFTSANVDVSDTSLIQHQRNNYGGATGVGVRILDAGYNTVTWIGTVPVMFTDTNPTQDLNFHARMESPTKNATEVMFTLRQTTSWLINNHYLLSCLINQAGENSPALLAYFIKRNGFYA